MLLRSSKKTFPPSTLTSYFIILFISSNFMPSQAFCGLLSYFKLAAILASMLNPLASHPLWLAKPATSKDVFSPNNRTLLAVMINFSDQDLECTPYEMEKYLLTNPDSLAEYIEAATRNHYGLKVELANNVSIPFSSKEPCNEYAWTEAANQALLARGLDTSNYQHAMYVLPETPQRSCNYVVVAELAGKRSWIKACRYQPLAYIQAILLNLGMNLAHAEGLDYGDASDPLGSGGPVLPNAAHQMDALALIPYQLAFNEPMGAYNITSCDMTASSHESVAVVIIRDPHNRNYPFFISYRTPTGFSSTLGKAYAYKLNFHIMHSGKLPTIFLGSIDVGERFYRGDLQFAFLGKDEQTAVFTISPRSESVSPTPSPTLTALPTPSPSLTPSFFSHSSTSTPSPSVMTTVSPTPSGTKERVVSSPPPSSSPLLEEGHEAPSMDLNSGEIAAITVSGVAVTALAAGLTIKYRKALAACIQ